MIFCNIRSFSVVFASGGGDKKVQNTLRNVTFQSQPMSGSLFRKSLMRQILVSGPVVVIAKIKTSAVVWSSSQRLSEQPL